MNIFGTDGIRGEAYTEVSLNLAYRIGLALSIFDRPIVVGIDTRESSPEIAYALMCGISPEIDVKYAGVIPTPGLMYYSLITECIGVMITASHNPYKDNGIKIFDTGVKISQSFRQQIEKSLEMTSEIEWDGIYDKTALKIEEEITNTYLDCLKKFYYKCNLRVAFDAANGCFSHILPIFFSKECIIHHKPNGKNINQNCGSTNVSSLIEYVKNKQFDLGVAFDGDGDRLIVVDRYNRIYQGDMLLYIFAKTLFKDDLLTGRTVVFSEVTNPGILKRYDELGISYIMTPVGDQNITNALKSGYVLGGESSGHIINTRNVPFGDGFINAMELIKILDQKKKKIHDYLHEVRLFYYKERNISLVSKDFEISKKLLREVERMNRHSDGVIILRKSGTENVLRIILYQRNVRSINFYLHRIERKITKAQKKFKKSKK